MAPTIPIDYTGHRESNIGFGDMMGKTRKVSRGYPTGFVPDYRHVTGTQAETEHLGSSGRVDDVAASEDSFPRKRKHFGVGVVGSDQFGVPSRYLSFSNMSPTEKRDLELLLTNELEKVRMLQSKIDSFSSDAIVEQPASSTYSYQNVSHRPVIAGGVQKPTTVTHGKKKGTSGRNGPRAKGGAAASRRTEAVMQVPQRNINLGPLMKQCEALLTRLMKHQHGWIFNEPVDVVKLKIPDYFTVIKQPMDLGTVKKKLLSGQYSHPTGFAADVRLTFSNALTYNPAGHDVHVMAGVLSEFFEVRWKPIEKKIPATADESVPSRSSVVIEPELEQVIPPNKQKTTSMENKVKQESDQMVMSVLEKKKLSEELEASLEELPENIIEFLKQSSLNGSQVSEDEIEIDIDALRDDTLFMLRKLLDDYILEKQRNQAKQGPCEIEMGSVSGFSNLSAQPHKENEAADEDVDIGGDDPPPISSSSPIEIDKDVTRRISSSSSSSSESGSSSSETDSGNSMTGELDGAKNSVPPDTVNEAIDFKLEQKESDHGAANRDSSDGHLEQSPTNSSLIEPSCHQEGENAPTERQVSPDKLYRAALLRSRFADIIIKAQENTNEKGERPNPEKLKLAREELERRRKEEKARLQAEAKAAEEARKKADEEAAAEAKKKRELEREAARLALQQMEKTVEINENSQFMEDLEIFKSAPEEHLLQSFVEEASPNENSRDCLGSFKFESSANPLEQLGLYMKNDEDEDDEEVELQSVPGGGASNDPEEGEID